MRVETQPNSVTVYLSQADVRLGSIDTPDWCSNPTCVYAKDPNSQTLAFQNQLAQIEIESPEEYVHATIKSGPARCCYTDTIERDIDDTEVLIEIQHTGREVAHDLYWYCKALKLPCSVNRILFDREDCVYAVVVDKHAIAPDHWKHDDAVVRREQLSAAAKPILFYLDAIKDVAIYLEEKPHDQFFAAKKPAMIRRIEAIEDCLSDKKAEAILTEIAPEAWAEAVSQWHNIDKSLLFDEQQKIPNKDPPIFKF